IDRSNEIKKWADKFDEIRQNEKNVKMAIVAANNHYGGFGPGTVNMFREMMEMEPLSLENVDLNELSRQVTSLSLSNADLKKNNRGNQTSISDFVSINLALLCLILYLRITPICSYSYACLSCLCYPCDTSSSCRPWVL